MIQEFVDHFMAHKDVLREVFRQSPPADWRTIVATIVSLLADVVDEYGNKMDPFRIDEITHGEYQGTLVYVIGQTEDRPRNYWYVKVAYGSCSGCDALRDIIDGMASGTPNEQKLDDYMTLALHIVQGIRRLE